MAPQHRTALATTIVAALASGCGTMGLAYDDYDGLGAYLEVDPLDDIDFDKRSPEAKPDSREVLLYSAGDMSVAIIDVFLDETTSSAFWLRDDLPLPIQLEPGEEYPLEIWFEPYAVGQFSGQLDVVLDQQGEEQWVTRPLLGRGCADVNSDLECD